MDELISKKICVYDIMSVLPFSSQSGNCQGQIIIDQNRNITVRGTCTVPNAVVVKYAAAAPADMRMSYTGSGLPYPNEEVAYEGSPNIGDAPVVGNNFVFNIVNPNAYYKDNGATMVQPHVVFTINNEYFDVPLPPTMQIPNRSLSGLPDRPNRTAGR